MTAGRNERHPIMEMTKEPVDLESVDLCDRGNCRLRSRRYEAWSGLLWIFLSVHLILPDVGRCAVPASAKPSRAPVEDTLEEVEILGANKYPTPVLITPQNVSVITRRQIKELCPRDLPDLLKLSTGVDVFTKSVGDFETSMGGTARDLNNRMILLIDGKPMTTPFYGCTAWQQIPIVLDSIDRIEIIKEPCSAQYGANAFAGVINIVTDQSSPKSDEGVRFVTTLGEQGYSSETVRAAKWNKDEGFTLTLRYWKDNGPSPLADISHTPIPGYQGIQNDLEKVTGVFDWEKKWGQKTRLSARVSRLTNNRSCYSLFSNLNDPRTSHVHDTSTLWFIELFHQISKRKAVVFKLQSNRYDFSLGANPLRSGTLDSRTDESDRFTEADLQGRSFLGKVGYIYGLTWHESVDDGFAIGRSKPTIHTGSAYGQAEYQFNPKTTGFLGLMAYESSQNGFDYSPKISVLRKLGEREVVRAGWGRSFRAPEGPFFFLNPMRGVSMGRLVPGITQGLKADPGFAQLPVALQTAVLTQVSASSGNSALAVDGNGNPTVLITGNEDLGNEHLSQFDLGWEKEKGSQRLKFDAWYSVMTDMIFNSPFSHIALKPTFTASNDPAVNAILDPTATKFWQAMYNGPTPLSSERFENTGMQQRSLGFSAEAGDNLTSKLRLDINYTYQHVTIDPAGNYIERYPPTGLALTTPPFAPRHKANLILRYRPTGNDTITAVTHYTSDYDTNASLLSNAARVPAYTTVDLSLLHEFKKKNRSYLNATVKNLFNDIHHEVVGGLSALDPQGSPAGGYLWDRFWMVSYGTHF